MKVNTDRADAGKNYRDDAGFYLTCDQMPARENADPEDSQAVSDAVVLGVRAQMSF